MHVDVLVIGGGINGLLSALNLVDAGCSVVLLESQLLARESSWAGGGIVSPLYPWRYSLPVTCLAGWAQRFYPHLSERLRSSVGIDPELYRSGLYWLDLEDHEEALSWGLEQGFGMSSLLRDSVCQRVTALTRSFDKALYMPSVANVRNPRLLEGLKRLLRQKSGLLVRERALVTELVRRQGRVVGVAFGMERIFADHVVLAAGAWSGELLATLGLHLPVEPVKGQMILYKCEPDYLPAMVLAEGRYAIARRDGHVLVGSTLEHVGFDKTPTEEALASLKASAEKMLPGLAQREVVGHWAGLRPGSPDGIPFIGEVRELPGLWLNCGHYRNGLVLAPASCELLKNLMLGETPIVDPAPYSPAGRLRAL